MVTLVDSSGWIDFWRDPEGAAGRRVAAALEHTSVILCDLVFVEVLQGLKHPRAIAEATETLSRFRYVQTGSKRIALAAAANYRLLRRRGITIRGTIDVVIATWCIENDVAIIHNDRDMGVMERELGLRAYA